MTAPQAVIAEAPSEGRSLLRDWRVWFGIAVTVGCLWIALRDLPLADVEAALARADLWLLIGLSVPFHLIQSYFRALRWRHLTNPIADIPRSELYYAQAIGFMTNNLVPLRIGELVRAWYLARKTGIPGAAILGTIVVERVMDVVVVLSLAGLALSFVGAGAGDGVLAQGARLMAPAAAVPVLGLVLLRMAPAFVLRTARSVLTPISEHFAERVLHLLEGFLEGLAALKGGSHLFWMLWHSLLIWVVFSVIPMGAGLLAFGVDLGDPLRTLTVWWILLAAVGVAVAIPSAPGFIGPYQLAFMAVLQPFGVDKATAFAIGLLVWLVFWVTMVIQGFVVMRISRLSLAELTRQADAPAAGGPAASQMDPSDGK